MLSIKSTPKHNFSIFIELAEKMDPEWLLGQFDDKMNPVQKEVEAEVDGKKAMIKLYDYFSETFERLTLLNFIFRLGYGFDGKKCQQVLIKKYPKINAKTKVAIILYELIEIA